MDSKTNEQTRADGDPLLPPPRKSSRERQRQGPMWGCLRTLLILAVIGVVVAIILLFGTYRYLGSGSFAETVRLRIEKTLEARLGREVRIGRVTVVRSSPQKVILDDIRIANAPGGVHPWFATARQVEIVGGIESFFRREVRVGRVDVRDPKIYFEVFPAGQPLVHNFPVWKTTPRKSRFEIARLDLKKLYVHNAEFDFLDRKHELHGNISALSAEIDPTIREQIYKGFASSPRLVFQIQDYEPIIADLRGQFHYRPGSLALNSVAIRGEGIEAFLKGKVDPVTQAAYDFQITSRISLEKVRQIFRVEKTLAGMVSMDGRLRGKQGDFVFDTAFLAPKLVADTYEIGSLRGRLDITGERIEAKIESGSYAGGTLSGDYHLAKFAEPYPMSIDLRYQGISIEKLFADWSVRNTGLRGSASGTLAYSWNKDKLLDGNGEGSATLRKGAVAFGTARYPIPVGGKTNFGLAKGVIAFRDTRLETPESAIAFAGTLRIEDLLARLKIDIETRDLAELDRIGFNFARSADKNDYELLGLGGSGTVTGTVSGPLKSPIINARLVASGARYKNVLLGVADVGLEYDGPKNLLTFRKSTFRDEGAELTLEGTLGFPDRGPSPRFDLAVTANGWPVERALQVAGLELALSGPGTGAVTVRGTPESGKVIFEQLRIARGKARVTLNGDLAWNPGEGNLQFGLDVDAVDFPVAEIAAFLDFKDLPVTGNVTGKLHLEGPKKALEGTGAITLTEGTIFAEPVDSVTAKIAFTDGMMRATDVEVRAPAGVLRGEGEFHFESETFSYTANAGDLDLSKIKALGALSEMFGGTLTFTSTGAGTFDRPEVVLEGTLKNPRFQGLNIPVGSADPKFYAAIRDGRLVLRASAFDVLTVEGGGVVGEDLAIDGEAKLRISDLTRFVAIFAPGTALPVSGELAVDLRLGGKLKSLETLEIAGTIPALDIQVSENRFTVDRPIEIALSNGRLTLKTFELRREGSSFSAEGFIGLAGDRAIDLKLRGTIEAALLQLFMPDLRAKGSLNLAAGITGTLANPKINGTAEILDAQVRIPGFPQLLDDIRGSLVFKGDRVEIDSLRMTLGGGTVVAGGFFTVEGLTPKRFRINLQGTDVSIRYFEGISVDGDLSLLLSGDVDHVLLQGDVVVDRAVYYKDIDFNNLILSSIVERRGLVPSVAASWQEKVALRIHVVAKDSLAIKNNIADVTGSAEIDLAGTLANPSVLGLVSIDEGGTIRFQEVDYRLVRGTINFQNPFRIDPYFDITAEGRVQEYELSVNLTGTIDRFTPTVTSDPPASDLTLLTLLSPRSLGQPAGTQPVTSQGLLNQGRSLLFGQLGSALGKQILPFADSVRLELIDSLGRPEPQVTFERRISKDLRVIVVYNTANNENREIVEWQVTPDWIVQFTRDDKTGETYFINAIDGRFRRRYKGHWFSRIANVSSRPANQDLASGPGPVEVSTRASSGGSSPGESSPSRGAGPPPGSFAAARNDTPGDLIRQVTFRADAAFDQATTEKLVSVTPGNPLSIREVRSSIKSLYATGNFRDIQVNTTPAGLDVDVTFVLSLNYRIASIDFEGLEKDVERARKELTTREGDVLRLDAVDRSAVAIQTMLSRRGYLEATVDPEIRFARPTSSSDVIFHVATGQAATITAIEFQGSTAPFTTDDLTKKMRGREGKTFRLEQARSDAERIEDYLIKKKYRKADVRFVDQQYDKATKGVKLQYKITVGPRVRVDVEGVSRRTVRRLVPFKRGEAYSEDVIQRAVDKIIEAWQLRGYFEVEVATEERLDGDTWVVKYVITPGTKYRLGSIDFAGNDQLPEKRLAGVISTARSGFIRSLIARVARRPQGVTRTALETDRGALEGLYILEGFTTARVSPAITRTEADGTLNVTFPIVEGPRTIVTAVTVEGNEQVESDRLPELQLKKGKPLNPQLVVNDLVELRTFYGDRGNVEIQVSEQVVMSPDKKEATVAYRIAEGPKVQIDDVIVRGNTYTKPDVILKTARLRKGEPFSYRSILEAQRNLYRLAIFQRVDVQPEAGGTTLGDRDIVLQVEEGKALSITGALGYASEEGARGTASVSHRNLFGTGRYLGLDVRVSRRQKRGFITFREPFILKYDIPIQFTLFRTDDQVTPDARIVQLGSFIEASRVVAEKTRWSLRYDYKIAECVEGPLCDRTTGDTPIEGIPREEQEIRISSVTPSFFWDTRDDPIDPRKGYFASSSIEYAFPVLDAEASFLKGFVQGAWFRPLGTQSLLAASARIGLIEPLASTGPGSIVPLAERFTGGGGTSHRAFKLDTLGILCSTLIPKEGDCSTIDRQSFAGDVIPIGGNALVIINAEYRFPLFGNLGGALFVDAGNVWREIGDIDTGEFRYGLGLGFRYITPVGPLRFDAAYNLEQKLYEDPFAAFLTLGYAF